MGIYTYSGGLDGENAYSNSLDGDIRIHRRRRWGHTDTTAA